MRARNVCEKRRPRRRRRRYNDHLELSSILFFLMTLPWVSEAWMKREKRNTTAPNRRNSILFPEGRDKDDDDGDDGNNSSSSIEYDLNLLLLSFLKGRIKDNSCSSHSHVRINTLTHTHNNTIKWMSSFLLKLKRMRMKIVSIHGALQCNALRCDAGKC